MNFVKKYIVDWNYQKRKKETTFDLKFNLFFLIGLSVATLLNGLRFVGTEPLIGILMMFIAIGLFSTTIFRNRKENDIELKFKNN